MHRWLGRGIAATATTVLLLSCLSEHCDALWTRRGIGSVRCLAPYVPPAVNRFGIRLEDRTKEGIHFIVGSAIGNVARMSAESSVPTWNMPAVSSCEVVTGLAVDKSVVLVLSTAERKCSSEEQAPRFLRALQFRNGKLLWEQKICDDAPVLIRNYGVQFRSCENGESIALSLSNGDLLSTSCYQGKEAHHCLKKELSTHHSRSIDTFDDDARIPLSAACARDSWEVGSRGVVLAKPTGLISFLLTGSSTGGWEREEGLAHPVDAAFYELKSDGARVIVVVSALGGVYGLDVANGKVIWSVDAAERIRSDLILSAASTDQIAGESPSDSADSLKCPFRMKLVKGHSTGAVVIVSSCGQTDVVTLNAADGTQLEAKLLEGFDATHAALRTPEVLCVDLLDVHGKEEYAGSGCPKGYPTGPRDTPSRWVVAHEGGIGIRGYSDGKVVWELGMPFNGKLLSLTVKATFDPLAKPSKNAPVRITGQRKVLYKFVEPSVALALSRNGPVDGADENVADGITATLLDTKTGAVIDVFRHRGGAADPVAAVAADNWFVYSFWNAEILEHEMHVIDMYDESPRKPWVRDALVAHVQNVVLDLLPTSGATTVEALFRWGAGRGASLGSEEKSEQCSVESEECPAGSVKRPMPTGKGLKGLELPVEAKNLNLPKVVRSSFLTTHVISTLGVTVSERGGTDRGVVMGLVSGRVAQISRMYLDARRPDYESRDAKNENLLTYRPTINLWPAVSGRQYFKEGMEVLGMLKQGGIVTSPVQGQESSSHIAVLGTDISYGTIAPAGFFDSLPIQFEYGPVLGTLAVLVVTAFLIDESARKNGLEKQWL